jgi:hypothetical protein
MKLFLVLVSLFLSFLFLLKRVYSTNSLGLKSTIGASPMGFWLLGWIFSFGFLIYCLGF